MDGREARIIVTALLMFLTFVYGVLVVPLEIFPYHQIKKQIEIVASLQRALDIDPYKESIRWKRKAPSVLGLRVNDLPEDSPEQDDYIIYTSTHDTNVRVINRAGEVVYEWTLPFDQLWDHQDHIVALKELGNEYFYTRDLHVYPDGDVLIMMTVAGITPWGVGLARVDKDSNVVWTYDGYVNNDFEVGRDGLIYAIEHEIRYDNLDVIEFSTLPFLEDNIVVLDPDTGQEVKRISLIDALDTSDYADVLKHMEDDRNLGSSGDPTHSNSIVYIAQDYPDIPWLKEGYLMISVRNLNAMVVLDPKSGEVVYARDVPGRMQHDFDVLENGDLLFFDNRGSFTRGGYTRVVELDLRRDSVVWTYDPQLDGRDEDGLFESEFWGAQQRLSNGHTMIAYAEGGRLIEVNSAGDIVWDYAIPLTRETRYNETKGETHIGVITSFEVYNPEDLPFVNP